MGGTIGAAPSAAAGAAGAGLTAQSAATPPGGALGEQAFLQLLVAQMQYQDPLQPMDSTAFVTQLAQFEMLAVLQHIQADLDRMSGSGTASGGGSASAGSGTGGQVGSASSGGQGAAGAPGAASGG